MKIYLKIINIIISLGVIILLITHHVDDGNIFGIYMEKGHLLVGDFWSASFIVYLLFYIIPKNFDSVLDEINKKLDKKLEELKGEENNEL